MSWLDEYLHDKKMIPSVANKESLKFMVEETDFPCIMLKMGNINTIPSIVSYIHKHGKTVMLHLDSVKGISKDKAGMHFFKRIGVEMIITMKSQHIRMIKDEGMKAILGTFLVDSSSFELTLQNIQTNRPDAIIVMPMTIPDQIYEKIREHSDLPIIAGGMGLDKTIIDHVLELPVSACSVTNWEILKHYQ